jgi:signal peptidase II
MDEKPTALPIPGGDPGSALILRRFLFALALVALDLWSKHAVFEWLTPIQHELPRDACGFAHPRQPLVGEWLSFMLSRNSGAAFGQFTSFPHILVGGRVLAVLFLSWLVIKTPRGRGVHTAALVLVLGGAMGNLYDNLMLTPPAGHPFGAVRDFIDVYFPIWSWHFPTFNVADSGITTGAALLLLAGLGRGGGSGEDLEDSSAEVGDARETPPPVG